MLDQEAAPPPRSVVTRDRTHASTRDRAGALPAPTPAPAAPIVDLWPRVRRGAGGAAEPERATATPGRADRRAPASPPGRLGLAAKRAVDLLGASAGLLVLSPLLLGTAVVIALVDGAPVLFRQERAGLREHPIRIYKFRTMRNGADSERAALRARNEIAGGASFKMTNDPRVTRLGRFLRHASIDELPQLLNVLRGEMSLVGPRPHPFDDLAGYQPWHHARFVMKPGITGLWQVSSRRDPDFDRWVERDLEYIRRWSPVLDITIMARTIPAMFRGEGR